MNLQTTVNNTQKYRKRIDAWKGLNRTDGAQDGEMLDIRNLCTDDYPTIRTRTERIRLNQFNDQTVTDVFEADGHLVVVADGTLYYDGEPLLEVGNTQKQFALVNTQLIVWPDKIVIDLNDGRASQMDAQLTGSAIIDEEGTVVTFSPGGAIQHGQRGYSDGGTYQNMPQMYIYRDLQWDENSGFTWSDKFYWSMRSVSVGDRFIPKQSGGSYYPNTSTDGYGEDGSIYGIITAKETFTYDYDLQSAVRLTYSIYDAAGGEQSLTQVFSAGDVVRLEGFTLLVNNKKAIEIQNVSSTELSFDTGSLVPAAYYFTVTEDLPRARYRLLWTRDVSGTETVTTLGYIEPFNRKIRAGEQIFVVGDVTTRSGETYIDTTNGAAYVYDPETMTLEQLEFMTGSYGTETIQMSIILPSAENEDVTISREIPDLAFICEHENRLWGVSNEETDTIFNPVTGEYNEVKSRVIFASALGKPMNIYEYKGLATDAYAVAVSGNGDFTAICSYNGAILAWKEDLLIKITGSYPAEYYMRTYKYEGVMAESHKSLQIINEVLYYLSPAGVMAYSGTAPQLIGEKLGLKKLANAVAGRGRTHYYISAQMEDLTWKTMVYDIVHGIWSAEETDPICSMTRIGNYCYAVIQGMIYRLEETEATEEIEWYAELACMDEGTLQHKRYTQITIEAELETGATIQLQYKDEQDNAWQTARLAWSLVNNERVRRYVLDTKRAARLYLRLSGTGKCKLYALEREYSLEAER